MISYRICEHCCKRVPVEGNHTCRPPASEEDSCPPVMPGKKVGTIRGVFESSPGSEAVEKKAYQFVKDHGWKGAPERERLEKCYLAGHASAVSSLRERLEKVNMALIGVISVADRKTKEFDAAHFALTTLRGILGEMK